MDLQRLGHLQGNHVRGHGQRLRIRAHRRSDPLHRRRQGRDHQIGAHRHARHRPAGAQAGQQCRNVRRLRPGLRGSGHDQQPRALLRPDRLRRGVRRSRRGGRRVDSEARDHRRRPDVLAGQKRGFGAAHRHDPAQLHRRTRQLRFGLVQNHPEALPDRCRFRRGARPDSGRDHAPAVYRRLHRQRPGQQERRFESPDQTVLLRPRRKRPDGLYREPRRQVGLLPEIRLLRRQHAGPLLEGAPLPERGHARKEELPRVLHHHGTYRGQHPRNLDARRVQDSGQDEDDRRTHRRRHLHAGVGHQPRNHVQGRRLHQLHRRLFVQGQHQPDRHGYRPALGRGPADVLRQHGPDHLHADQYGRSLAAFQLGPRPGFQLRRTAGFGHVPRHRRG